MKTHLIILLHFFCIQAFAQSDVLEIDLAKVKPGKAVTINVMSGDYNSLRLKNKVPISKYDVKYEVQNVVYDELDVSGLNNSTPPAACVSLKKEYQKLEVVPTGKNHDEEQVPDIVKKITNLLKKGQCTDPDQIEDATDLIAKTSETIDLPSTINLGRGDQLYVRITRDDGLQWIVILKTRRPGSWRTMYGFTYVPEWWSPNNTFRTTEVANSDPTMYTIKSTSGDDDFFQNISPTIMFTWVPNNAGKMRSNNFLKVGVVGGIVLDLEKPTAMFGPSFVFADNLSVNFGVIFTERSRLKSKYQLDDMLGEPLDFDQLHETGLNTYKPEFFISIGFRFSENPFSKSEKEDN